MTECTPHPYGSRHTDADRIPSARPTAHAAARASLHSPTMSISNPATRPPPGSLPQETRQRGRTLIWPHHPYRQPPFPKS